MRPHSSDQADRYNDLLRALFREDRGKNSRDGRSFAVVSVHAGAGVTYVTSGIRKTFNDVAVHSEVSRMAAMITETVNNGFVYSDNSRIAAAIREAVSETGVCVEPSRLAVAVDCRKLLQPGAQFGAVVAEALDRPTLNSTAATGRAVQAVLDDLTVEWSVSSNCRRDCLQKLSGLFRLSFFEVPPLKESSEIRSIAPLVDGVIVVVEADRTTAAQLARLTDTIRSSGGRLLGYVLNKRSYPIPGLLYRNLEKMGLT